MSIKQYVVFKLGKESFGVDIEAVNEITDCKELNKIPNAPYYFEGITNLRGEVIPLINLKKKFNIEDLTKNVKERVIVTSISNKKIGFIVDDASETVTIDEKDIDPPSVLISNDGTEYIHGIGKLENRLLIILNLEKILSPKEREQALSVEI